MSGGGDNVEVGIPADSEVPRLRLRRIRPDGDALVLLAVSVEEGGLSAAITVHTLNGDGLDDFLAGLDKDFRGWPGGRHWKSHEGDLELEAVHTTRYTPTTSSQLTNAAAAPNTPSAPTCPNSPREP